MKYQTTKIRGNGPRYTGLTDLEWAKITVAKQQYNVACETFDKLQSEFSGAPKSSVDLAFAEYMVQVEEILASSNGGRRVKDDEPEKTVLVGDLLDVASTLLMTTHGLCDPYSSDVDEAVGRIFEIAGVHRISKFGYLGDTE